MARVESYHYPYGAIGKVADMHLLKTNKIDAWRHAAYHATESYGGTYSVVGNHFMYIRGVEHFVQSESVTTCDIYDGWWDQ